MSRVELEALLKRPDTLRQILGNYRGPYSIGVTPPQHADVEYSITLLVSEDYKESKDKFAFIEGKRFPLIIQRGLQKLRLF